MWRIPSTTLFQNGRGQRPRLCISYKLYVLFGTEEHVVQSATNIKKHSFLSLLYLPFLQRLYYWTWDSNSVQKFSPGPWTYLSNLQLGGVWLYWTLVQVITSAVVHFARSQALNVLGCSTLNGTWFLYRLLACLITKPDHVSLPLLCSTVSLWPYPVSFRFDLLLNLCSIQITSQH